MMKQFLELPLMEPMYSAFQYQSPGTAIAAENPSVRNWYLNEAVIPICSRHFLRGLTTPELDIENSSWIVNPHLDMKNMSMEFLDGYMHPVIRKMLEQGYYVYYYGLDDYYIPGKSWYKERHFNHDGLICGYNRADKTYCLYAYDQQWRYQKFWVRQSALDAGRKSSYQMGIIGSLCGLKVKPYHIPFEPKAAYTKIKEYLNSSLLQYPYDGRGPVRGIVVQAYIAKYLEKILDGTIPPERMDRRVFRLIWEHKKAMLERIEAMEASLCLDASCSTRYRPLTAEADALRLLYASYRLKPRSTLLQAIQKRLLSLMTAEQEILNTVLYKTEKEL